jgi:hypothetical protein
MENILKITFANGQVIEMPYNEGNRRYYERMNERDETGQNQVKIEVVEESGDDKDDKDNVPNPETHKTETKPRQQPRAPQQSKEV